MKLNSLVTTFLAVSAWATNGSDFDHIDDDTTIEVLWLQDFSTISEQALLNLKNQLVPTMDELKSVFKHSRYGIAGFVDKPIAPFGDASSGDYCYHLRYPLTRYIDRLNDTMQRALAHSGLDWQENHLGAMINALESDDTRWTPGKLTVDGYIIKKVLVLTSDAGFHEAGDFSGAFAHPGIPLSEAECLQYDYPSVAQVSAALKNAQVLPIFLVTDKVVPLYRELIDMLGEGILYIVEDDFSNIRQAFLGSMSVLLTNNDKPCKGGECCVGPGCCRNRRCREEAAAVRIILEERPGLLNLTAEF